MADLMTDPIRRVLATNQGGHCAHNKDLQAARAALESLERQAWKLAAPVQAGIATSAVTLTFGCGHVVHAINGDALYHTCPFCFVARLT